MPPESILKFIEKHEWTFAKSMPKTPHWYVIRENCVDAEFVEFVEYISKFGSPRRFFGVTFTYLNIGRYSYWSMKDPVSITENMPRILNRELIA